MKHSDYEVCVDSTLFPMCHAGSLSKMIGQAVIDWSHPRMLSRAGQDEDAGNCGHTLLRQSRTHTLPSHLWCSTNLVILYQSGLDGSDGITLLEFYSIKWKKGMTTLFYFTHLLRIATRIEESYVATSSYKLLFFSFDRTRPLFFREFSFFSSDRTLL